MFFWSYLNRNYLFIYFMRCIKMNLMFMNLIKFKMFTDLFYVMHL
jgi:hypothetical protein